MQTSYERLSAGSEARHIYWSQNVGKKAYSCTFKIMIRIRVPKVMMLLREIWRKSRFTTPVRTRCPHC